VLCVKEWICDGGRPPWESLETSLRRGARPSLNDGLVYVEARAHGSCRLISPTHYHFLSSFFNLLFKLFFPLFVGSFFFWNFFSFYLSRRVFFVISFSLSFSCRCYCSTISFAYAMSVQIVSFHLSVNSNKLDTYTYIELNRRRAFFISFYIIVLFILFILFSLLFYCILIVLIFKLVSHSRRISNGFIFKITSYSKWVCRLFHKIDAVNEETETRKWRDTHLIM
jgi:hypothetical protein